MENSKKNTQHKQIVAMAQVGLFAAVIAILTQIGFPLPTGINVTLQTLAVSLAAYTLGWKKGTLSVLVFIALGAVGLPVFSNFSGGFGKLLGVTGGYIWGFIPMALLCGIGIEFWLKRKNVLSAITAVLLSLIGLAICHLFGSVQFALVTGTNSVKEAFLLCSAPYLIKDIVSMILSFGIALAIRKAITPKIIAPAESKEEN